MRFNITIKIIYTILAFNILINTTTGFSEEKKLLEYKNISNYFNGIVSNKNKEYSNAIKYLNSTKEVQNYHRQYLKELVFALVSEGKINQAAHQVKSLKNDELGTFFEANLIISAFNLKNDHFKKASNELKKIIKAKEYSRFEIFIAESLMEYLRVFNKQNIHIKNIPDGFDDLRIIQNLFLDCYSKDSEIEKNFIKIIKDKDANYKRYIYFYINYLISENRIDDALNFTKKNIDRFDPNLISTQTKIWLFNKDINKIKNIFNCRNTNHIIGEFFYLIAILHANENMFEKSNFYLNLSLYFNPKFIFNKELKADNFLNMQKYKEAQRIYENFEKENFIYFWNSIKKISLIKTKLENDENSLLYLEKNFNSIKNPDFKIFLDLANIFKNFEKYNKSIKYYSKVLNSMEQDHSLYPVVLFRRGASYERIGKWEESDKDLLQSLKLNPNAPHVLNYLAYSWLERDYNLAEAMKMLEIAYKKKPRDPYIIDSIGWAYYMLGKFKKAESYLKIAVELMPEDPIVNDHYGDILWKSNKPLQATYAWKYVLSLKNTNSEMKEKIKRKIVFGI